ncbi:MAG: glycosyltransferase [Melioribacteraceae bacterium]|nr:glycosyltransferase [Melioribacteraceae bacterium]
MTDISIIIVNYNVKEYLNNLLNSLEKASGNLRTEIIVVDNASSDGSAEEIPSKFPAIKFLRNEKNLGFGKANNQGLELANGEYILLINPDTIVKEDTIERLIQFLEANPDAGMVSCKVLNPDGTLQLACRRSYPTPWVSFSKITGLSHLFPKSKLFAKYNLTYLDENEINEVDAISGAFMLFRRNIYNEIGGFDPKFFMYGEDLDFCYRIQQAGYKIYYVPSTEIIHYKGESTKRSNLDETKVFYDAMHLFVQKHFSSSFLVKWILKFAIGLRKSAAFANRYKLPAVSFFIDLLIFIAAFILAENIYSNESWRGIPYDVKPWVYIVPAIIQGVISLVAGAYKRTAISVLRTFIALFFGIIVLSALTFFFKQYGYSRAVLLICYAFLGVGLVLWRIFAKLYFKVGLVEYKNRNNTLIVGTKSGVGELINRMNRTVSGMYKIKGLIGNDQKMMGEKIGNFSFIGSTENLRKIIEKEKIQNIVFSTADISYEKIFSLVTECQGLNVQFLVAGSGQDYLVGKSEITSLEEIPFTRLFYNISDPGHKLLKGILDLSVSVPVLLFVYPFIYFSTKVSGKKSKFAEFVLQIPKVLVFKKSLVGPEKTSFYDGLYIGRTGLTGFWNLESASDGSDEETNKLNLYYAKNQNIWLDIDILGKTLSKYLLRGD